MRPVPGLPDLVFTANAGVVVGRRAVVSRFRYPERQREEAYFEDWFRSAGYDVVTLEPEFFFEGAGDLLGFSDCWFGGYRQRSDIRVFPLLSDVFTREIIPLELVDGRFYHLDTCFCPLSGGELLYFPAAFDTDGQEVITERMRRVSSHRSQQALGSRAMRCAWENMWCCLPDVPRRGGSFSPWISNPLCHWTNS
jgi:N-dimethylarginine dimethylaminohydrolase